MGDRVTRSQAGYTANKPHNPGFVDTPGRKRAPRKTTPVPVVNEAIASAQNGYANGHADSHADGPAVVAAPRAEKERVRRLTNPAMDTDSHVEFGGSWGVLAMMVGFPALMYYMWLGAVFFDGGVPRPAPGEAGAAFAHRMAGLVAEHAFPHRRAWAVYWAFLGLQAVFYLYLPGVYRKGKPLPHLGGRQLDYYCSAMWSLYATVALALALHVAGVFPLHELVDEFGPLMSVAILSGFLAAAFAYGAAWARGTRIRMTGAPLYDFFMGSELNPRLAGWLDFKMFLEVRIPWFIVTLLSVGTAVRQLERYGTVSAEVVFVVLAHWLYANACSKGEHHIITTWDMYYEKLGFMLIFWNMAGVPLTYCHCTLYLALHDDPARAPWPPLVVAAWTLLYLAVYYVWDTCNSQKNQFRQEERGGADVRRAFPCFAYGRIENPITIPTRTGDSILCDGWYGKARKLHYTCDLFFALSWGLSTGFRSPFPWFYSAFFAAMIVHRARRDIARCRARYGEAWAEYERRVPYLFIPYVF